MELRYGHKYVIEISLIVSLIISFCLYRFNFFNDLDYKVILFFIISVFTMPCFLRFLICFNWKKINVKVQKSEDLSKPIFDWRNVTMHFCYRAAVEYEVDNIKYKNIITSSSPFEKTVQIYYKPSNPSMVSIDKGLGLRGSIFLISCLFIVLYKLFPNLLLFTVIKELLELLTSFKSKL